jgi:hypothetical protein
MEFQLVPFVWATLSLLIIAGLGLWLDFKFKYRNATGYFLLGQISMLVPICTYALIVRLTSL